MGLDNLEVSRLLGRMHGPLEGFRWIISVIISAASTAIHVEWIERGKIGAGSRSIRRAGRFLFPSVYL
jgi:hypothetical protein